MPPILRLIVTDLDGTLIGNANEFALYDEFQKQLDHMRARHGAVWVVCTGRTLRSFRHFIEPMQTMGVAPEYAIIRHAYVYRHTRLGYRPHLTWNFWILMHLLISRLHIHSAINEWHALITGMTRHVTTIYRKRNRLCLRFDREEDAEAATEILTEKAREFRHLRVFRYLREVDIRMVPFTKGLAVYDLASRLGIPREEILAIGNGHNDISMLDGRIAKFTGCPGNAESAVMEIVHASGGHIAREHCLGGVVQILNAYLDGTIDSSLPPWWSPAASGLNPHTKGWSSRPPRRPGGRRKSRASALIFVAVCYAVLVVFASFDLMPFSDWIMKPVVSVGRIAMRILTRLGGS